MGSNALVAIYSGSCRHLLASGQADESGHFAIEIEVPDDSVTSLSYQAGRRDASAQCHCQQLEGVYVEDSTPPPMPVISRSLPESPSSGLHPIVEGRAEPGSTVRLYAGASCEQPLEETPWSSVRTTAKPDGAFSIPAFVRENTANEITARAFDAAENPSPCSPPLRYVHDGSL